MGPSIKSNSISVKPMFFHTPSMSSTCDSAENIATPAESDFVDEQIMECAGFTDVLTGERSKWRPITSLSLFPNFTSSKVH